MKKLVFSSLVGFALGILSGCAGSSDTVDRTGQHCE